MSSFDVVVGGGGMAGVCAAIAASRSGARTVLLERSPFLGGVATAAAVVQFMGWNTAGGERLIGGIAEEIAERVVDAGGADGFSEYTMSTGMRMDRFEFDVEVLKVVLDEMVVEAGVTPLFHTSVARVERQGSSIKRIIALSKGGEIAFGLKAVVDATGDLDIMSAAGCKMLPLEVGEELQPASLMFRMGPVDFGLFDALTTEEAKAIASKGVEAGELGRLALSCNRVPGTDDGWFNVTRISVDGTDPFALAKAEMEGRRQALAAARFISRQVPGCSRAKLQALAAGIGIRETRRVQGRVVVTESDLRAGRVFPDAIGMSAFPIDLHHSGEHTSTIERLGDANHRYTIPLGALVPADLDNALVAGRGISATHTAFAALRIMTNVMVMGQAAGIAAAMSSSSGTTVPDLSYPELRRHLLNAGALLPK